MIPATNNNNNKNNEAALLCQLRKDLKKWTALYVRTKKKKKAPH
jgi:hypothetical protein